MKNLLFFLFFAAPAALMAQKKSDLLVRSTCSCLQSGDMDQSSYDALVTSLGLCMAPDALKYYDDLCKEFHLDKDADLTANMEKIGEQVGLRLMAECPEFRTLAMELMQYEEFQEELADREIVNVPPPPPGVVEQFEGKVEKIDAGDISSITVSGHDETFRFLWLERFGTSAEFEANPMQLIGKRVVISYTIRYFYNASSGLYSAKKVVAGIEVK